MWTRETRGRMAAIERKTKRYPTDLTDTEWERIAPLLPKPPRRGSFQGPRDRRDLFLSEHLIVRSLQWWRKKAHRRSEEHTSELQSLMRISYAVFCLKKKEHTS